MPNASVIRAWRDATNVYLAAMVNEGGSQGNVEYIGSMPVAEFDALPDAPSKKAAMIAAVKAERDARQNAVSATVPGIAGSIAI